MEKWVLSIDVGKLIINRTYLKFINNEKSLFSNDNAMRIVIGL